MIYYGRKEEAVMKNNIEKVIAAIDYIENHLSDKVDLELVAEAVHYSKYYLHRIFTKILYIIFDYPHKHYTFKQFEV